MTEQLSGGDVVDAYLKPELAEENRTVTSHDTENPPYQWGEDGKLQTDPRGMWPVPAEVDDAAVWPSEADKKGKTIRDGRPDPAAVAMAVRRAQQMQDINLELLERTPDHDEVASVIARGRRQRADWRALEDRAHADRIAQADKQRQHEAGLADKRREYENTVAAARERRFKAQDPTQQLARLAWAEKYLPAASLVPAVLALFAGAVNVYNELTRINPDTWIVNAAVEPLFTFPLMVILVAQMLGALPKPDFSQGRRAAFRTNRYLGMEIGLAGAAVVLNVVVHWLPANHWSGDLVWLAVPAGLGFSAYLVPRLITDIRQALAEWTDEVRSGGPEPVESTSQSTRTEPIQVGGLMQVNTGASTLQSTPPVQVDPTSIPDPARLSDAEAFAVLTEAVRSGQVDPDTGRPVDPASASSIQRTLRVGRDRSRTLRDQWKTQHAN